MTHDGLSANDPSSAARPALTARHLRKTALAGLVRCSVWILIIASFGMGRVGPRCYTGSRTEVLVLSARAGRGTSRRVSRARDPDPCQRRQRHAVLSRTAPILLRGRFARQNDVPVHLRSRWRDRL